MSLQLTCPNCGRRPVSEFMFKSEVRRRPGAGAGFAGWSEYVYVRENRRGKQWEWWFHRSGCQGWFVVERDTTNNVDHRSLTVQEARLQGVL